MKVKTTYKPSNNCIDCWVPADGVIDVEISTQDLLTELNNRRQYD